MAGILNSTSVFEISPDLLRFQDAELVVGGLSVMVNAVVLYFICFKTPPSLHDFRSFIFAITFADVLFDIFAVLLLRPIMFFPSIAAVISGPVKSMGPAVCFYLAVTGIWMFFYCMFCINLAFLYRYACIANQDLHRVMVKRSTQILFHIITIGISLGSISYMATQQESHDEMLVLPEYYNMRLAISDHFDQFVIVGIAHGTGTYTSFIAIPATCGLWNTIFAFLTVRHLHSFRSSFTAATYKMHIRFVTCLSCQMMFPALLLGVPITLLLGGFALRVSNEYYRTVASGFVFVISCHPLVNAACTLFFIQPYRQLISDWIRLVYGKIANGFRLNRKIIVLSAKNTVVVGVKTTAT